MHLLHTEFIVGSSPTIATIYTLGLVRNANLNVILPTKYESPSVLLRWQNSYARVCKTLLCWCDSSPQLHSAVVAQSDSARDF